VIGAHPVRWRRPLPVLLGGLLALLLLVAATGGPDCLQYLDWSRAARTGEIAELPGDLRSPVGLPVTQWSHGPGLFFALPYLSPTRHLVGDGPFAPVRDFRLAGWVAALALWGGLLGMLRRVTADDTPLTLFVAAAAFAGTHLGFYSFVHSSEILSFGCLALIAWRIGARRPPGPLDLLVIGALAGCLVLVRPNLVVYLPLMFGVLAWRSARELRAPGAVPRVWSAVLVVIPILFAVGQVLWVNRWMTGSLFRSPYTFGDGAFRSLDLARPELLAVLIHPWHGLLVYHPVYAVAFVLVLARIFRGSAGSRWLHLGIAATLLVHLWIQAAWYCWWLGMWSLGNRGLGTAAVLLIPVLAHAMRERGERSRLAIGAVVLGCAVWSLALMVQGHTNFVTWGELLASQAAALRGIAHAIPVALLTAAVAWFLARGRVPTGRALTAGAVLLSALVADHMALRVASVVTGAADGTWTIAFRVFVAGLAPFVALIDLPPRTLRDGTIRSGLRLGFAAAVLAVCLGTGGLFLRLALRTERVVAAGGVPGNGPVATFQVPEVEECLREYRRVPGFDDRKRALKRFLERTGRD
jgi:hypothetical protein